MHADQESFTRYFLINLRILPSEFFKLSDQILAFLRGLLPEPVAQRHPDRGDRGRASQGASASRGGMHERIWIHHWLEDFFRGYHRADRHNTTAERLGSRNNIGHNLPMVNTPHLARAPHASLNFIRNQ